MQHPDLVLAQARAKLVLYPAGNNEQTFLVSEIPADNDNLQLKEMWDEQADRGLALLNEISESMCVDSFGPTAPFWVGLATAFAAADVKPQLAVAALSFGITTSFLWAVRNWKKNRYNTLEMGMANLRETIIKGEMQRRHIFG